MKAAHKERALAAAGSIARRVPLDQVQMFAFMASPQVRADPWALYQRLHRSDPIRPTRFGVWLVASHDAVNTVLRHPATTVDESQASGPIGEGDRTSAFTKLMDRTLLFTDPPDHTRLRRLVSRSFTPRTVARLREPIEAMIEQSLAQLRPEGSADLISQLALPLPVAVICELLGIPEAERARFLTWARHLAPRLDISMFRDAEIERLGDAAAMELVSFLGELIDNPGRRLPDGLIAGLVDAEDDDRLDREEIIALCGLLLLAGFETTTNLIGNGVHTLLGQPEQLAALREGSVDPATAVEELLRHDGPVQLTQRVLLDELDLGGRVIPPRTLVALLIGAANRDPRVFDDPDALDLSRDPNPHLAFSSGIHHCLGAALARLEAAIAIPAIVRQLPNLRMAGKPTWRKTFVLRGLTQLPVRWG
ncbi:MAG: cytochrome P450 [Actinomycetota bacterium]